MAPPADDSEVMIDHSALVRENHVVDLHDKEPMTDSQGNYLMDSQGNFKDGADLFGPKMQQLRLQLLQQHQDNQKIRDSTMEEAIVLPPAHKAEASMAKKGMSLAVWFCFNSLTLILNKYLFSVVDFHYPLTLTAVHMVTCFFLAFLIIKVFKWVPYQPLTRQELLTKILPLSIIFCANIVFGNFSIRWIPISFMQTVKSSVPVFTVLLQWMIYRQTCAKAVAYALIPVVGGVALASCTEVNFVMGGFICALFGSFLTALQAVILHSSAMKLNPVNLILYTSPISLAMLIIPCAAFEFSSIKNEWAYFGELSPILWLALSGTVAFALNYSSFIVSGVLSALTMTVAGNFKAVINIVASVLVFGNPISMVNWVGCLVATGGVMWYNQIMNRQKHLSTK